MSQRILQLDNQLANQIAAGEVVERPASVVKELLENSVDAGATRIEVDIERGGARLIRIIDNGSGIHKDDLPLALSRHATSKISSFNDLCAVKTMGFRGEALASIASISRLSLRTRQQGEDVGWQAQTEGRDMAVKVSPVAATEGTCLEVRDLFFNTPARRKFLRTEKTEFAHIEDVVKRAALANPSVAIVLKHNNKVVKRFPASADYQSMQEKVIAACGRNFVANSQFFSGELDELKIYGWLGDPSFHRSESDNQFIFINQRAVKDRLLGHAIRQSYSERLPVGRFASYIIFIDCPVTEVDVNVHPTKHEVRFRNPRLIHDFLVKLLQQCLNANIFPDDQRQASPTMPEALVTKSHNSSPSFTDSTLKHDDRLQVNERSRPYNFTTGQFGVLATAQPVTRYSRTSSSTLDRPNATDSSGDCVTTHKTASNEDKSHSGSDILNGRFGVKFGDGRLWLVDYRQWLLRNLPERLQAAAIKPLLIPKVIQVSCSDLENPALFEAFKALGIELTPAGETQVMLRKLPELDFPLPVDLWERILTTLLSQDLPSIEVGDIAVQLQQLLLKQDLELSASFTLPESNGSSSDWRQFALEIGHDYLLKHLGKTL